MIHNDDWLSLSTDDVNTGKTFWKSVLGIITYQLHNYIFLQSKIEEAK